MATWNCDQKVCATCRYWDGNRDVDFMACFFEVLDSEGRCDGPFRSLSGRDTDESDTCGEWEFYRMG